MSAPDLNRDIFKDNAAEPEFSITKKNPSNGTLVAAAGIVGATIHLSATDAGAPIHVSLSGAAVERVARPGYYAATFAIAVINAQLFPAFDKKKVFWVWTDPSGSKVSDPVYCWSVRPSA